MSDTTKTTDHKHRLNPKTGMRIGSFTKEEIQFIRDNSSVMTDEEIGEKLKRTAVSVYHCRTTKLGIGKEVSNQQRAELECRKILRQKKEWLYIKEELNNDELDYFEYRYGQVMAQFKDDVLTTEEMQIFQLIKLEIMQHRIAKEQKEVGESLTQKIHELDNELAKQNRDFARISHIEGQVGGLRNVQSVKSKDYTALGGQIMTLMKDMKVTREQRIKQIEGKNKTFFDLLKTFNDKELRDREILEMGIMFEAQKEEFGRLSVPFTFGDSNKQDVPILNEQTIQQYFDHQELDTKE